MVATQSVELTSHEEPKKAQVARSTYPRVDERIEGFDNSSSIRAAAPVSMPAWTFWLLF
jgi:hypothetical protein